ncbi:ABC transporter permease [Rhodoligotrophos ferricapiens]|uniref:ABC transporter permease n=1 Tax=Rhodoligotrophos ferricapiens TaxID=3069264 RepID=UPI00315CA048
MTELASAIPRDNERRGLRLPGGLLQVTPAAVFILLLFNIPLLLMLSWSVGTGDEPLKYFAALARGSVYMKVLGNTIYIALLTTLACCILGYPLAYWMWSLSPRRQMLVLALVVLTFWISILVRTYSWIVVLGNDGVVNRVLRWLGITETSVPFLYNQFGVIVGTTNVLLPFLVLPLFAAMLKLDRRLLQAAESMGASQATIFFRIFLPLTIPALAAGSILVFILTLGFFITPAILGGGRVPMIANMLDLLINRMPRWETAAAISTVLLVLTLLFYAAYQWIEKKSRI